MNRSQQRELVPKDPYSEMYKKLEGKKSGSFFAGVARLVLLVLLALGFGGLGICVQGYFHFTRNLPSIEKLRTYTPPIVTRVYAEKDELIGEFAEQRRFVVPIDQMPKLLQNAFIAAEDKNFWKHSGVDKEAVVRAIKRNLITGSLTEGASTITQQVAKTFLLTGEKKFTRKIKEAILSTRIEQSLSKEQILYLYLNQIFFGSAAYGVEAAAQTYFDKKVGELSIAECAMLAGLPKAPSKFSPRVNLKRALERRAYVLKRMLEDGHITEAEYETALQETPQLTSRTNVHVKSAPDFVENVRRYIENKYGKDALYKDGLQVWTTVDLDMTRAAQEAMDTGLRELDKRQGYRGPMKTLTAKGVADFLEDRGRGMEGPLRFGQVTDGVVTHIDAEQLYVRLGTYGDGAAAKEFVGKIKIDPSPKWWVRTPFLRPELRTRNFSPGDLPFQVGDLIRVRILDPNPRRRELYQKKYGKTDPEMKNYKEYSEEMVQEFPLEIEQDPVCQSALMFRENRTGYVKVVVGGYSYRESKFNRAIQSRRQAGSSFKPAIYAAALNKGFTAADIILDSPLALAIPGTGEVWRPKNYRGGFQGPVTLRDSLVQSRNIPTIKILQQIGIEHAKSYARRLGYTSPLVDNLTLALGSTGVSLEEQLNVFSVFANRGYGIPGVYIKKIVDRNGKVLEQHDAPILVDEAVQPEPLLYKKAGLDRSDAGERSTTHAKRKIDEATAYILTTMLQGVVKEGTATNLKKIVGRTDIAGKTGTTNENVDAWFMGYSPDFTCGVWVGFDDEFSIGEGETGGKAAAPIWGYFMREALKDIPVRPFPAPATVEVKRIDPRTGLVTVSQNGVEEVFKVGSAPAGAETKIMKGPRWDYTGSDLDQF